MCEKLAKLYFNQKKYSKAIEKYNKALEVKELLNENNSTKLINFYSKIEDCYHNLGEYEKSFYYHKKRLKVIENSEALEEHVKLDETVNAYVALAANFYNRAQYEGARYYYDKALEAIETIQVIMPLNAEASTLPKESIGQIYEFMGKAYIQEANYKEAFSYRNPCIITYYCKI
jgi:tetratricopeptide (TPR) repeat protein